MEIRNAKFEDLEFIIEMLADDDLGSKREDFRIPIPESYVKAFNEITSDKGQNLMVVQDNGVVIGTFQLSIIPYLTYQGRSRAQMEAVRVSSKYRGKGIGKKMIEWCLEFAHKQNCHVLQLTTDKKRPDAIRFYKSLGFIDSHEGMKYHF